MCKPKLKFMGWVNLWELHKLERSNLVFGHSLILPKTVEQIKYSYGLVLVWEGK